MAGFVPNLEIPIVYTGLRPGEKLHEELMTEEEEKTRKARNRVMVAESPAPPADLKERLVELRRLADAGEPQALLQAMRELVPSFRTPEIEPLPDMVSGGTQAGPKNDVFDQDGTQPPTFPVPPGRA